MRESRVRVGCGGVPESVRCANESLRFYPPPSSQVHRRNAGLCRAALWRPSGIPASAGANKHVGNNDHMSIIETEMLLSHLLSILNLDTHLLSTYRPVVHSNLCLYSRLDKVWRRAESLVAARPGFRTSRIRSPAVEVVWSGGPGTMQIVVLSIRGSSSDASGGPETSLPSLHFCLIQDVNMIKAFVLASESKSSRTLYQASLIALLVYMHLPPNSHLYRARSGRLSTHVGPLPTKRLLISLQMIDDEILYDLRSAGDGAAFPTLLPQVSDPTCPFSDKGEDGEDPTEPPQCERYFGLAGRFLVPGRLRLNDG
ncbi:hypothetical protein CROQUDRAFT_85991 [Cronartium quercuum f. sp. fusiforme G11]|uniref:Uncharacterized protein n=1 Tax=Cronartium quercuum f. sp. fusiforme G11 TaxID=708437 RepID=A0A9P6NRV3_9BASI|nr:hypothetical protein CROQUDRAFT_85991 [Cronartium quercuum f. sp. fusiforme G11]